MKLEKVAVWSTSFIVALIYTIMNAIMLAAVQLVVFFFGKSTLLSSSSQSISTSMTALQWVVYVCSSFVIAFVMTALAAWLYNLFAKKLAIKFELKK